MRRLVHIAEPWDVAWGPSHCHLRCDTATTSHIWRAPNLRYPHLIFSISEICEAGLVLALLNSSPNFSLSCVFVVFCAFLLPSSDIMCFRFSVWQGIVFIDVFFNSHHARLSIYFYDGRRRFAFLWFFLFSILENGWLPFWLKRVFYSCLNLLRLFVLFIWIEKVIVFINFHFSDLKRILSRYLRTFFCDDLINKVNGAFYVCQDVYNFFFSSLNKCVVAFQRLEFIWHFEVKVFICQLRFWLIIVS